MVNPSISLNLNLFSNRSLRKKKATIAYNFITIYYKLVTVYHNRFPIATLFFEKMAENRGFSVVTGCFLLLFLLFFSFCAKKQAGRFS